MGERKDGGQAFPSEFFETEHGDRVEAFAGSPGMSLRDWFAGQVLSGFVQRPSYTHADASTAAKFAYLYADAMLAERLKP